MYYCYRHIRLDKNEPFYIGIGKSSPRYKRWTLSDVYRRAYCKQRSKWWKNIAQNGYRVDILFESENKEDVLLKEQEFISLYGFKCNGGTLCNITSGGDGGYELNQEEKDRIRKRMMGNKNSLGNAHTEEAKKKMSQAAKGRVPWCKGKRMSKEFREKISQSKKGVSQPPRYNCRPQQKKVLCHTNGEEYNSICECVRYFFKINAPAADNRFRVKKNNISLVCNGKKESYLGHKFSFV